MNRKIVLSIGEFYHIYNRGVEKKVVFVDKYDYDRFILLLSLTNSFSPLDLRSINRLKNANKTCEGGTSADFIEERNESLVDIGAYCLMPNHFHLLIHEKAEGGITKFMHKLTTAYTMYFNKKYDRVGPLFQGTFKSQHANSDEYLKYLFSYIHLNPLKIIDENWKDLKDYNKKIDFINSYSYSSYFDYVGIDREDKIILNTKAFPDYFSNADDFKENLFDWLSDFEI